MTARLVAVLVVALAPLVARAADDAALAAENVRLAKAVVELTRQVEDLTVALAEARMELDRATIAEATGRPEAGPAETLRAAEIAVREVNRGLSLVVLDAGASAGLRPGMVFALVRGDEVVARVRTVDVRARIAGARIEDLPRGIYPERGDRAVIWRSMTE